MPAAAARRWHHGTKTAIATTVPTSNARFEIARCRKSVHRSWCGRAQAAEYGTSRSNSSVSAVAAAIATTPVSQIGQPAAQAHSPNPIPDRVIAG